MNLRKALIFAKSVHTKAWGIRATYYKCRKVLKEHGDAIYAADPEAYGSVASYIEMWNKK